MYDTGKAELQGIKDCMISESESTSNSMHKAASDSGPTDARTEDKVAIEMHMQEICCC